MPNDDALASGSEDLPRAKVPELIILGQFADAAQQISYTFSSLLMCTAVVDEEGHSASELLVPFVETSFFGSSKSTGVEGDFEGVKLFSQTIALDNSAYMISDLCSDMSKICHQFRLVSSGQLSPEPYRLSATTQFLREARDHLEKCIENLDQMAGSGSVE